MPSLILLCLLMLAGPTGEPSLTAPGGNYLLELASEEVKMSHWVDIPSLYRVRDKEQLWSAEFPWSLSWHHWISSEELELELRRYPGDRPAVKVQIRLFSESFRAWDQRLLSWSDLSRPLRELNAYLEECYHRQR
jgi:hypothetical protein